MCGHFNKYQCDPFKPPSRVSDERGVFYNDVEEFLEDDTIEYKHEDKLYALTTSGIPNVQMVPKADNILQNIELGTDDNERIGKKIFLTTIHGRGIVRGTFPEGVVYGMCIYIWILLDTQYDGVNPSVSTIFHGHTDCATCFMDLDEQKRFKIIRKLQVNVNSGGHDGRTPLGCHKLFEFVDVLNIPVNYTEAFGLDPAEVTGNNILICYGSSSSPATQIDMGLRIKFTDL